MVGAANIEVRGQARNMSKISCGSKPPDSGTTFTPRRITYYPDAKKLAIERLPWDSRAYLERVTGRRATLLDIARHFYYFAAVTLDRVFLMSEKFKRFDVQVFGLDELRKAWAANP